MRIRPVARVIYGLIGIVFLLAASAVLLLGTGLVPSALSNLILEVGGGNPYTMHLVQEYCTFLFFMGLVNLWCVRHYDHSLFFHWGMTLFWALFALVHWFDYTGNFHPGWDRVVDTVPFVVFLVIGIIRQRTEGPVR